MNVIKCDVCDKLIGDGKWVSAGKHLFPVMEFCYDCGAPIVELLKKHKFFKDEKEKK